MTVEGVECDARRTAHRKRTRFFCLKPFAGAFIRSDTDVHSLNTLLAGNVSLGSLHLALRFAHGSINLALSIAPCLARDAGTVNTGAHLRSHRDRLVHIDVNIHRFVAVFRITFERCRRAKRQSVLCVSDPDGAVNISELDVWTTSTNLAVHAVAYVLTV